MKLKRILFIIATVFGFISCQNDSSKSTNSIKKVEAEPRISDSSAQQKSQLNSENDDEVTQYIESLTEVSSLKEQIKKWNNNLSNYSTEFIPRSELMEDYSEVQIKTYGNVNFQFLIDTTNYQSLRIKNPYGLEYILYSDWRELHETKDWYDSQEFFGAYNLGDEEVGILFELSSNQSNKIVANLLDQLKLRFNLDDMSLLYSKVDSLIKATDLAHFILWNSPMLDNDMFGGKTFRFNVACQRGVAQVEVDQAYFSFEECRSSFVFLPFKKFDFKKFGTPIIAYKKGKFSAEVEESMVIYIDSLNNAPVDYEDSSELELFGKVDDYHIAFSDDFQWQDQENSALYFPTRLVIKGGKNPSHKGYGLDLFGIGCD